MLAKAIKSQISYIRNLFLLLVFVSALNPVFSQCLATFQDINNVVYVFDNGVSKRIEEFPLQSFQIGRSNILAYIDKSGSLKVFYKGKLFPINTGTSNYKVTDNWMVYKYNYTLKVLYNDKFIVLDTLFRNASLPYVSDSLLVWTTNTPYQTKVFYNGETQILDPPVIGQSKIGDNIFAYSDIASTFKVVYHGQIQTLENYVPANFLVDRDMVLYPDQYGKIKFYQNGQLYETNTPMPEEYWTGEGFGAYISPIQTLMVFYNGKETSLTDDLPVNLTIKENLIIYSDKQKNFWCWYKGKKYMLERYTPEMYSADNDIIVYHDINGRLKAFYYGEQLQVSDQMVDKFQLFNEAITYSIQPYQTKVWCNKKTYTFE